MQTVENMEDLLTVGLTEEELNASAKSKVAYTAIQKYGFELMFEFSDNPSDRKIVEEALNAPLRVEEEVVTPRYGQEIKEVEAKRVKKKYQDDVKALAKMEKERLKALETKNKEESFEPKVKVDKPETPRRGFSDSQVVVDRGDATSTLITTQENVPQTENKKTETPRMTLQEIKNASKKTRVRLTGIEQLILNAFNDLYIMTRSKHVKHYKDDAGMGAYATQPYSLTDRIVIKHIRKKETVAVFGGKRLTKFICFDVDSNDLNYSEVLAKEVIAVLTNVFKIESEYINVSVSGSKGYHVELFFEGAIENRKAKLLHTAVLSQLNILSGEVEFRPTYTQAVKMPLSINYKTGRVCNFVNIDTFEEIDDPLHITTIKKLSKSQTKSIFEDKDLFTFESNKAEIIEEVIDNVNDAVYTTEDAEKQVVEILNKGHLLRPGTRNNATFKIAVFLKEQGNTKEDVLATINGIMLDTWNNHRLMIIQDNTLPKINEESARIVDTVYLNNYGLTPKESETIIYESEMEAVISVKKGHLRNLLFSFILQSKKHAKKDGIFFYAYSTMTAMGNAANRGSLLTYVSLLEEAGLIEIVSRGTINKALTKEYGRVISDTNTYRLTLDKPDGVDPFIVHTSTKKEADLYKIAKKLIDKKTIKDNTSRDDWDNHFKKLYK